MSTSDRCRRGPLGDPAPLSGRFHHAQNRRTRRARLGRDAAAKIWYRALTVYMTSSTTYAGARTATLNAARDLYGAGSVQQNTVAAAWSAVSVG